MTQVEIEVKLNDHDNEIKSLKHRMNAAEENDKVLTEILLNVRELATNMSHMVKTQERQDEYIKKQDNRIERLEKEPYDDHKHYKKAVITGIVTTVVGTIVGALMALIINGGIS